MINPEMSTNALLVEEGELLARPLQPHRLATVIGCHSLTSKWKKSTRDCGSKEDLILIDAIISTRRDSKVIRSEPQIVSFQITNSALT
ncbi:hypothetical protein TNIN_69081 [Trichonephila inaurata madagascariensis]|uniref:Uncharacterized protein n=1 Tax=Trichonephila inaurata madagascariensis TaxID=2747483 RepID=A0A8X6JB81_9ARAC|nr:hypothetical protein TNIN_69081 [Trichonephila inaurata madagascariensis]